MIVFLYFEFEKIIYCIILTISFILITKEVFMKFVSVSKFLLTFVVAALLAGCCGTKYFYRDSKTNFAAEAIKPFIESGELSGVITVFCKGDLQEVNCSGYADLENKRPISLDDIFMQCSQTKGFCGVTIAMLVEEGKLSLDDPVYKYLPEFKELKVQVKDAEGKVSLVPAKNVLTVRMVMNHTGGFPFEIPTKAKKGWPSLSLRDTAKEAAANPLLFEPGTRAAYSNTGIDIGAAIVEVITGQPWEAFLAERVFKPLEMNNSTFTPTDEQLKNSILLYYVAEGKKAKYREYNGAMPLPHNGPNVHPSAGAGLWTTANDQLKFYKMLMNLGVGENGVRILKEETVLNLLATSTRPEALGNYSLGLFTDFEKGDFGHGGAWGTSANVNWRTKELRLIVIQMNGSFKSLYTKIDEAAQKFFQMQIDSSGVDGYTGRLE